MLPKKHFGQNFLTSIPARIAIVKAGDIVTTDTILEIGPGKGFLTQELLTTGAHIIALEKDVELLPLLKEMFSHYKNFTLVEGDALTYIPPKKYKIIANIPYYITGAILSHYLSCAYQPETMVVLVQKEVAERVVDTKESILSLSVKAYGTPKIVYRVNKGSFNPAPSVDSAVLKIENISRNNFINQNHETTFFKIIKQGFAHKRKYLLSNLRELFPKSTLETLFEELFISSKARAEEIPLSIWLLLSQKLTTGAT